MNDYSIKLEKLQATASRTHKMETLKPFVQDIIHRILAMLLLALFLAVPIWVPKFFSSIHHILVVALSHARATFVEPKCLFILCNVIIVVLVGESRLSRSSFTAEPDVYEEYVERTRSMRGFTVKENEVLLEVEAPMKVEMAVADQGKNRDEDEIMERRVKEETKVGEQNGEEEAVLQVQEDDHVMCEVGYTLGKVEEEDLNIHHGEDVEEEDVEDDSGWSVEELNRRVLDFIAKVHEQRRLEMLSCIDN